MIFSISEFQKPVHGEESANYWPGDENRRFYLLKSSLAPPRPLIRSKFNHGSGHSLSPVKCVLSNRPVIDSHEHCADCYKFFLYIRLFDPKYKASIQITGLSPIPIVGIVDCRFAITKISRIPTDNRRSQNRYSTENHNTSGMTENPEQPTSRIAAADVDEVRLVQLTDCHIFDSADDDLLGMNTRDSFAAVSKAAIETCGHLDLLLVTGDLSQDGSAASYEYLARSLDRYGLPTYWIPGNHDDSAVMQAHFQGKCISPAKQILIGAWQIVMLDSTIPGEVAGRVSESQLDYLDHCLSRHPELNALVCLHHQARETGSDLIDKKGLRDAQQLRDRLLAHPQLRAVVWGHVHQEYHQTIDNVQWMSTPSSCVQFEPGSMEFSTTLEAPGYRRISLFADGRVESSVQRVAGIDYQPDFSKQGY